MAVSSQRRVGGRYTGTWKGSIYRSNGDKTHDDVLTISKSGDAIVVHEECTDVEGYEKGKVEMLDFNGQVKDDGSLACEVGPYPITFVIEGDTLVKMLAGEKTTHTRAD